MRVSDSKNCLTPAHSSEGLVHLKALRGSSIFLLIFLLIFISKGCVDQDFDAPPAGGTDPGLTPTLTIAELKAMHTLDQYEQITTNEIIRGIVISDDEEGNFFRQLVIQDETGGIEIRIDATDLFAEYPPGRQVYVRLKDLWLGDFNGLTQLGAAVTGQGNDRELVRLPESLLDQTIIKGTYGNEVVPQVLDINDFNASHISTLVQLNDVQFPEIYAGVTYADAVNQQTLNLEIENCDKDRMILRTSGFATFAGALTPEGKGSITGVFGVFGTDLQLIIRDLEDVNMTGERCQIGGGNTITIQALRDAFNGGQSTAPDGAIRGVVISDRTTLNTQERNLFIQDGSGGIAVRFAANHSYNLGDDLVIDVSQQQLTLFNGLLQISEVPLANAESQGQVALPAPRVATVNEILTNAAAWESTRIMINDVMLNGASTFNGNVTVTDATGAMIMFTRSQATFSATALPTGEVDMTAILSDFNAPQLVINSASDVSGGGTGGGDINEGFSSQTANMDVALAGWLNVAVKGARKWRVQVFDGNNYAQGTAFNDTAAEMETWLITPAIDVSTPKWLSFTSAQAFWVHDGLAVFSSTDFNGSDIQSATWTPVSADIAGSGDADHAWIPSGDIDLEAFSQPVYFAFRYVGSGPGGQTTSYRVDDIVVRDK